MRAQHRCCEVDGDGAAGLVDVAPRAEIEQPSISRAARKLAANAQPSEPVASVALAAQPAIARVAATFTHETRHRRCRPVGVQREADPGEPDGREETGEHCGAAPAEVADERRRQFGHREHLGQVEKQFQSACRPGVADL